VGTKEDPAKAVDGLLSMMEFQVVGAAKAMRADKYSFAPAQGIFTASQTTQFDTVRTFVAQVTHLAQANYFFFGWSGDENQLALRMCKRNLALTGRLLKDRPCQSEGKVPQFERHIGVNYSAAPTAESSPEGLRVYAPVCGAC
jgi:hypothetical protein